MRKLGKRQVTLHLANPLRAIPAEFAPWRLELKSAGRDLVYTVNGGENMDIARLLDQMSRSSVAITDLQTHQSSLEDIFVSLVSNR